MRVGSIATATVAALLLASRGTTEKSLQEKGQRPWNGAQLADMFATGAFDFKGSEGNMSTVHFHADHTVDVSWQGGGDTPRTMRCARSTRRFAGARRVAHGSTARDRINTPRFAWMAVCAASSSPRSEFRTTTRNGESADSPFLVQNR